MLKVKCAYKRCEKMMVDSIESAGQRYCSPRCVAGAMCKIREFNRLTKKHGKREKMIEVGSKNSKDRNTFEE